MDASDSHPRRIKEKEILISQKMMNSFSQSQMDAAKLSGRDHELRYPLKGKTNL